MAIRNTDTLITKDLTNNCAVIGKKIADLVPDAKNANRGSERGNQMIEDSLREYGAGRSILLDKHGRIIAGNKTAENAVAIGMEDVLVVQSDGTRLVAVQRTDLDLDDPHTRQLAIADNRSGQVSLDWDADVLKGLVDDGVDLAPFWTADELATLWPVTVDLQTDEDDVPPVPEEPKSKLGDLYVLGDHRLLCGDSTSVTDVERLMGGQKAEYLFTSPPYADLRTYGQADADMSVAHLKMFIRSFMELCSYVTINLGLKRKEHEVVPYWDEYIAEAKDCGYKFLSWGVWARPSAGSVGNQSAFFPCTHEWMFTFGKAFKDINRCEDRRTNPHKIGDTRMVRQPDGSMKGSSRGEQGERKELESVIFLNPELGAIRKEHPATFPVALPEKFINAITSSGESVVDPFGGSGSTLIACEKTGRKCYMMELSPQYCDVIVTRWEQATGKKAVLSA
jgi:DNA modification methylase